MICLIMKKYFSYTGKLYAPQESSPAKMIVRFPLSKIYNKIFP